MAFLEGPFVALEDFRSVVPVSQCSQRIAVGQPAIEIDFAVIPVELPKVLGDPCGLPSQPPQAGRFRFETLVSKMESSVTLRLLKPAR